MRVLGISAFYHDSAAALVEDGHIVAAAQEERFTRKKHDPSFPRNAIAYCMEEAKIELDDLDHVVFYDKPFLKFERLDGNLCRFSTARVPFVQDGNPAVATRKIVSEEFAPTRTS